jgi:NAD(P)-dependent dehydrogenase (short-subunit alcohol dehydrogenase family)
MAQKRYGTVFITGANRGLGLEFTRQFASDAERVIACCRSPSRANDLNRVAADSKGVVITRSLDVTDGPRIKALATEFAEHPIDLLINNAGVLGPRPESRVLDADAWRQVLEVNTISPIKVVESFLDSVAMSERRLIVNITSKMGSMGDNQSGGAIIYRSSKAALNAAMKSLALDTADRGVTVLLLHPGWVTTDMGGPNGLIDSTASVNGMKAVIDQADQGLSGHFLNYDGAEISW